MARTTTPPTHWTEAEKATLVQQLITGEVNLQQACAAHGISAEQLKDWVRAFRRSMRQALDHQLRSTLSIQGLEVEDLSRAEFSGDLQDINVADLLQTIQLGRKDAQITVTCDDGESRIWCDAGEIVDAESNGLCGEEAVYRILAMQSGSLCADFSRTRRPRRITASTPRLLLDAVRHNDERGRLLRRVGDPAQVFSVDAEIAAKHAADLDEHELAVLSSFDGSAGLEAALAASGVPQLQALAIAVRFFEGGLLKPNLVAVAPAAGNGERASRPSACFIPVVHSYPTERPPAWLLAAGALVCSGLGAATAVTYANMLVTPSTDALPDAPRAHGAAAGTGLSASASCPMGMVFIAGGKFFMGSDSNHPALAWARPAYAAAVNSFCIDINEVSVEQYAACSREGACAPAGIAEAGAREGLSAAAQGALEALRQEQCNTGKAGREQHPQNCVSYHQAARYCASRGTRLPTEAEWEFAAKGVENRLFPWGSAQPSAHHVNACGTECQRWYDEAGLSAQLQGLMYEEDDGHPGSAPVGSFPLGSTPDGVMDLIGNVFEWTAGGLYAYERRSSVNPAGPATSDSYVIRGGNFNSGTAELSDPALRFAMDADAYSHGVGFRCASSLQPALYEQ